MFLNILYLGNTKSEEEVIRASENVVLLFKFLHKKKMKKTKHCDTFNANSVRASENFLGLMYLEMASFYLLGQNSVSSTRWRIMNLNSFHITM